MKKGVVIFAHNSRQVDYALMSIIAGGLAKKYLGVPVSLISDESTIEWLRISKKYSKAKKVFDQIIEVKKPVTTNQRLLVDTYTSTMVPFVNSNRASVWDLTPYDRTLLIDSDFLIMSKTLAEFWDADSKFMISSSINDVRGDRLGVLDKHVSDTGMPLSWATTVMFTKDKETKLIFDMVDHIRDNYGHYADLYNFNPAVFRNDIAFSVAKHILYGFEYDCNNNLPPVLTALGRDLINDVEENKITLLINDEFTEDAVVATTIKDRDIHVMNKQSIIRNANKFLSII